MGVSVSLKSTDLSPSLFSGVSRRKYVGGSIGVFILVRHCQLLSILEKPKQIFGEFQKSGLCSQSFWYNESYVSLKRKGRTQ